MRPLPALVLCLAGLAPAGAAAQRAPWPDRYGGPDGEPRLEGLEQRALELLRRAQAEDRGEPCRPSARLTAAARVHAMQLLHASGVPGRIDPRVVRLAVLRAGAVDPSVEPWAASFGGAIDLPERVARFARRHAARPLTRCGAGLARGEGRSVLVVLGTRRRLALESFPSRLVPGDRQRLEGRLLDGYRAPSMVVTTPRGEVVVEPAVQRSGRFGVWLDFPSTGRYAVEVMATGPRGPEVVALFPVFVGTDPDELSDPPHERPEARDGDAASVVLELLNAERRRAGLPALEVDDELVRLAAEHSADMLEGGWFGHVSPAGTDVVERLRRAGIVALRAAENLARSDCPERAHEALMASPSHRANVLDRSLTHVGVGAARTDGEVVVTQILVAW